MVASPVHLLAPDEKPAFEVVNAQGRGRALFLCDHASAAVPRALRDLGLAPEHFGRHIAWDIGAAEVARRLSRAFDAPLVLSGYSRLVIDCNRRPGDATSIPEESDRTPVPGNRGLSPADRAARATACFEPYHKAIAQRLAAFATRDWSLLRDGMDDRIHQPARGTILAALHPVIAAAIDAGAHGAALSGAGSAMIALATGHFDEIAEIGRAHV